MISLNKIGLSFGSFSLFSDVSFLINPKDKIGLIGKNGAGKSTLMKLIAGKETPSSGSLSIPSGLKIGYLPQQIDYTDGLTLLEEAKTAFQEIQALEAEMDKLGKTLSDPTANLADEEYINLSGKLAELSERHAMLGAHNTEQEAQRILAGLGFQQTDHHRPTSEFSGGWRMRIELAKILLQRPNLLLLDEPTNHLDIESIQWLENFLKNYNGAVFLVSHDKAFLDNVTLRTIDIVLGKTHDYRVSYSKFLALRAERREQQLRAYENQQKLIKDTEIFIERFRYKASKSVQVQSRIKQLEKLERIEIDEVDNSRLNIRFSPPARSGQVVLEIEELEKSYGDLQVLDGVNLIIERGEKVAFVGKNGEGKSTLVKCIMEELDYQGSLKLGHNVSTGYFAQNQAMQLDGEQTVYDTIDRIAEGDFVNKIRELLGAFMFGNDDIDKKVKVLSGGERSRLAMIQLLLEPYNLLVLDEPTNHLDIRSKEILKDALKSYEGTVILVSHDRDFLDGLVDKVYEFSQKKVKEHLGGIYDFLERKMLENLSELNTDAYQKEESLKTTAGSSSKEQYLARKEEAKKLRKHEKAVAKHEQEIEALESKIADLDKILANPPEDKDISILYREYERLQKLLETEMSDWEAATEVLEKLK